MTLLTNICSLKLFDVLAFSWCGAKSTNQTLSDSSNHNTFGQIQAKDVCNKDLHENRTLWSERFANDWDRLAINNIVMMMIMIIMIYINLS